jgi:hypothetical protein
VKYDYKALRKLKKYRTKIEDGLRHMHALLSLDGLMFEAAERTFEQEIERLRKRIGKQVAQREVEMKRLSEEFAALEDGELERIGLSIYDPRNQAENGKLTGRGVRVCEELFERRVSPLAVAYLMQLSYQATSRRYKAWKAKAEP